MNELSKLLEELEQLREENVRLKLALSNTYPEGINVKPNSEKTEGSQLIRAQSILVVEDNELNQKLIRKALVGCGHNVALARNGEEACIKFAAGNFDMVLMDIELPVMGGIEATKKIRATTKGAKVPIIAITSTVFESAREHFMSLGLDDYVSKPITLSELKVIVSRQGEISRIKSEVDLPAE